MLESYLEILFYYVSFGRNFLVCGLGIVCFFLFENLCIWLLLSILDFGLLEKV